MTQPVIYSIEGHDGIDDEQPKDSALLMEFGRDEIEQFHLVLRGVSASVENVIQHGCRTVRYIW